MLPKLGPLACSTDWFLNGVSWYKENYKDTWKDAHKGVLPSGVSTLRVYIRYKTGWDTDVNFDFVFLFSVDIH